MDAGDAMSEMRLNVGVGQLPEGCAWAPEDLVRVGCGWRGRIFEFEVELEDTEEWRLFGLD